MGRLYPTGEITESAVYCRLNRNLNHSLLLDTRRAYPASQFEEHATYVLGAARLAESVPKEEVGPKRLRRVSGTFRGARESSLSCCLPDCRGSAVQEELSKRLGGTSESEEVFRGQVREDLSI